MVLLLVTEFLFDILYEKGNIEEVKKIFNKFLKIQQEDKIAVEIIVELALFYTYIDNKLAINYIYENYYNDLENELEKKELDVLLNSSKKSYEVIKFEKTNEINEIDQKYYYNFYLKDMDSSEEIIFKTTQKEFIKYETLFGRFISLNGGKDYMGFGFLSKVDDSLVGFFKNIENFKKTLNFINDSSEFSDNLINLNDDNIDFVRNDFFNNGRFPDVDEKIFNINLDFFNRFGESLEYSLNDRLDNLDNVELVEKEIDFYISKYVDIYPELILNTNYLLGGNYFNHKSYFYFLLGFFRDDVDLIKKSYENLCKEIEIDFDVEVDKIDENNFIDLLRDYDDFKLILYLGYLDYFNLVDKAYLILKPVKDLLFNENNFLLNWILGRIYSSNDDIRYKKYFKICKKINKDLYKNKLELFLNKK